MADLFSLRDPKAVATEIAALQRFATRRDTFIETLDLNALDDAAWRNIHDADTDLGETIMFAQLYAQHLGDMIALGHSLSIQTQQAA